ncbi:MAG: rhodanese-like domain-containing protein [Peptococcaceae bacterium]
MKNDMQKIVKDFFLNIPKDKYGIDLFEFESLVTWGNINKYFLLDVREFDEFQQVRIPGSVNIPCSRLAQKINDIPVNQQVIIISEKGIVAAQISSLLNSCGFKTWTLREGIEGYLDIGGDIEGKSLTLVYQQRGR